MEQYKPNIGEVPDESARRDAIHIAVAPIIAGSRFVRGEKVWIHMGKAYGNNSTLCSGEPVGIVDPYLDLGRTGYIEVGQRFWLFLFPNTITNLRHVWEHPAFTVKPPGVKE